MRRREGRARALTRRRRRWRTARWDQALADALEACHHSGHFERLATQAAFGQILEGGGPMSGREKRLGGLQGLGGPLERRIPGTCGHRFTSPARSRRPSGQPEPSPWSGERDPSALDYASGASTHQNVILRV